LSESQERLQRHLRRPREDGPDLDPLFETAAEAAGKVPAELALEVGSQTTLRAALGDVLKLLNTKSNGGLMVASADLVGSTSVGNAVAGFPKGYFHATSNPGSRLLSIGGICEDAATGLLSGLSAYGRHIGVGSSYAAFLAPLGHIAARLHAIGNQARRSLSPDEPNKPVIFVCAHAGLKTGEDGPTHADPQALQLLQQNFPTGTMVTLTPWDPQELWPLMTTALAHRPAVIAPFVTRPAETVIDRLERGLAPASAATTGVYELLHADPVRPCDGTIVLQGSGVTYAFVEEALPLIEQEGLNRRVIYIASTELFDLLPTADQERIYPQALADDAMGITGFTLPTLYRWVSSKLGREMSLYPFMQGHYLGSGQAEAVLREAGLDGRSQFEEIRRYVNERRRIGPSDDSR